jgi:hypothetical protein
LFFNLASVKVLSVCSCKTFSCSAYFPAQLWFAAGQTASSRSLFSSYFQSRFNRSGTTSAFALLLRCSVPSRCSKSFTYDTTLCFMFAHTFQTFYRWLGSCCNYKVRLFYSVKCAYNKRFGKMRAGLCYHQQQ